MLPELRTNLPAIISEPALLNYSFQVRTQREIDGYYDFAEHLFDCRIKAYSRPLELRANFAHPRTLVLDPELPCGSRLQAPCNIYVLRSNPVCPHDSRAD